MGSFIRKVYINHSDIYIIIALPLHNTCWNTPPELISFPNKTKQQKPAVSSDPGGLSSKVWTMSPPAPLRIKDTQVFDRRASSFSGLCRLKTDIGVLSFFLSDHVIETHIFAALGLQPLPRPRLRIQSSFRMPAEEGAKRLQCNRGALEQNPPT